MSVGVFAYLLLMSVVAGTLNGIVGMATLALYPVLLSIGVSPIIANATTTIGILFSGTSAVISSRRELKGHWRQTLPITAFVVAGGIVGDILLIRSSVASFKAIVPFTILLAGVLMVMPRRSGVDSATRSKAVLTGFVLALLAVGCYCGYFGAGSGLLMIAVLSRVVDDGYPVYNAIRNFASLVNNVVSAVIFIFTLSIAWKVLIPMCIGLLVGGYCGPIVVRVIPAEVIKWVVGLFAIVLAVVLFVQNLI